MKKLNFIFRVMLGMTASLCAWSADSSKVVDLGEMEVQGDIRRPAITWIDSQKPVKDGLSSIIKTEFERFETQLLAPALAENKK